MHTFRDTNDLCPAGLLFVVECCRSSSSRLSRKLKLYIDHVRQPPLKVEIEAPLGQGASGTVYSLVHNPRAFPYRMAIKMFPGYTAYKKEVEILQEIADKGGLLCHPVPV